MPVELYSKQGKSNPGKRNLPRLFYGTVFNYDFKIKQNRNSPS